MSDKPQISSKRIVSKATPKNYRFTFRSLLISTEPKLWSDNSLAVPKSEYVANTGKKAALTSFGGAIVVLGLVSAAVVCALVVPQFWSVGETGWLSLLGVLGGGSLFVSYIGAKIVREGKEMATGVPLTRANTGQLPAADTLVRPSQAPRKSQQAELLRAAGQGPATPPQQLLRAGSQSKPDVEPL